MLCRTNFNCHIYYAIDIILACFFKLNVSYCDLRHSYEVDAGLFSCIKSYLYEIIIELLLLRRNDRIAPVLETCRGHYVVTPSTIWSK